MLLTQQFHTKVELTNNNMKTIYPKLLISLLVLLLSSNIVVAQNDKDAPWLDGVTTKKHHDRLSPVVPLNIYLSNGDAVPATLTEDIPVSLIAETKLFNPSPPVKANGVEIPTPIWIKPPYKPIAKKSKS